MPSIVISHIVGTVSLLVVFGIVAASFAINYSILQLQVISYNLQQIADYVSAETCDLVSLCFMSSEDQFIFKELDLPEKIGSEAYMVSIVLLEDRFEVVVNSTVHLSVFGESPLPWSRDGNIRLYNGTNPGITGIAPGESIQSISKGTAVVWCLKDGERITFGLGERSD